MPNYNKIELTEQARRLGFLTAPFEKMRRLTEILQFLNETDELRETLALKGGTAINLAVLNLPRLSMDIDLDLNANLTKEETQEKRDKINGLLERYMAAEGYIKKEKSKCTHILDSHVYSYVNVSGNFDNIKIEINYSLRCHLLPVVEVDIRASDVFTSFPVRTLAPIEIFASKIVALSSRAAARDLYDLNNMIHFAIFDELELKMLRKCAVFYKAITGDTVEQGFDFRRLDDISQYKIRTELNPMISNIKRFNLREAHDRVALFLKDQMTLTEKEASFLLRFNKGHYEPRLLFNDEEIIKRVENHPMAMWRLRHNQMF